jgi:hypothetical protein
MCPTPVERFRYVTIAGVLDVVVGGQLLTQQPPEIREEVVVVALGEVGGPNRETVRI